MLKFITKCAEEYHSQNSYHNFKHAFVVTHIVYLVLVNSSAMKYIGYLEIFAALVAALGHDIDHPGVNNDYLIKIKEQRALIYSDDSVLERHHASTLFKVINR